MASRQAGNRAVTLMNQGEQLAAGARPPWIRLSSVTRACPGLAWM